MASVQYPIRYDCNCVTRYDLMCSEKKITLRKDATRGGLTLAIPIFNVKKIIFNPPATIVFWADGTKTVVKCADGTEFNPYFGFTSALAKKVYGNNSRVNKIVAKSVKEEKVK